jgi:hypothetical protein
VGTEDATGFMKDLHFVNRLKCKVRVLSCSLKASQSVLQYHDSPSDVNYSAFSARVLCFC